MHVQCKKCASKISVLGRPSGSNALSNVQLHGNVSVTDGGISFGPGGGISFAPGGGVSFGGPQNSTFSCLTCGALDSYAPTEIKDD